MKVCFLYLFLCFQMCCFVNAYAQSAETFPVELVQWVRDHKIPITSTDPDRYAEMSFLDSLIPENRLLLLGEGTHGTREIFQIKDKIVRYLMSTGHYTKLGIEYDLVNGFAVNDYIHGANNDLYEALNAQRGWVWNTEEIADMIRWLKKANEAGKEIGYYGIDVFKLTPSAFKAFEFLKDHQIEAATYVDQQWTALFGKNLAQLNENENEFYDIAHNEVDLSLNYRLEELLRLLVDLYNMHRDELIERSSKQDWMIHRQLVRTALIRSVHLRQFNMHSIFTEEDWRSEWQFFRSFPAKVDSLDQLLALTEDPALQKNLDGLIKRVANPYKGRRHYLTVMNFQERSDWKDQVLLARERLIIRQPLYLQKLTEAQFNQLANLIDDLDRLLKAYSSSFDKPMERLNAREIGLAQNAAFLDSLNDQKTIIWVHNLHAAKVQTNTKNDGDKMGTFLKQQYEDEVLVIGTFIGEGSLQAWEYTDSGRQLSVFGLNPPKKGSLEDLLRQADCEICLLDLRNLPEQGPVREWFSQKQMFRSIGNYYDPKNPDDFYITDVIPEYFDMVIFIDQTSRARPTPSVKRKYFE